MNQKEKLILRSPMRKQLGGLWILFCALGAFLMWQNGPKSEGSGILLFGAGALALLALYRCLTFSLTVFLPGKVPTARNVKAHFGIFKQEQEVDFDELEILRRDMFLPYCQLYAFSSPKYLKAKLKQIDNLIGYNSNIKYEKTKYKKITVNTAKETIKDSGKKIIKKILKK